MINTMKTQYFKIKDINQESRQFTLEFETNTGQIFKCYYDGYLIEKHQRIDAIIEYLTPIFENKL